MYVNFASLLCRYSPRARSDRPAAGSINRCAVFLQPFPNGMQALDGLGLDLSVGVWADVEQEVGVRSGGAYEIVNQVRHRLEVVVVGVVSPGTVDRLAGLEWKLADCSLVEACAVRSGQVFLEHLEIFALDRGGVVIAADQGGGLELMNQRICSLEAPVGLRLVPHAVEPDAGHVAVVGEEFGQLRIHEVEVAVEVAAFGTTGGVARL